MGLAETDAPPLRLHATAARSRGNGPGLRAVIWFQGCPRGCPGCCNPQAQGPQPNLVVEPAVLAAWVAKQEGLEGVTVTGGEPLAQPAGLLRFLRDVTARSRLSVVLFSGHTLAEIRRLPQGPDILHFVDVLIDGPYDRIRHLGKGLRGSLNQQVHLLTPRYRLGEIEMVPETELLILSDGTVVTTGVGSDPAAEAGFLLSQTPRGFPDGDPDQLRYPDPKRL